MRVYTEQREHDNSKTHQCQDEERNTGSLQADFSHSHQTERPKGTPSESRETQGRADFIVRRLGDRDSNLSSFVENIICQHLEKYGEDIGKWRRL
ncbi:DUF3408 domain-containing protein [Prevotella nigrescens]|uniref:DUF3408 domain-containing protein n=1 Tax=Prevotella nigrescens TaxID=28133 RepID=UPI0035256B3B